MSHIAAVLKPHSIGLGLSINSVCESESLAVSSDPTCAPAYRDTPWAAVLTDMGTYDTLTPGSGQWPFYPGKGNVVNMSWTKDLSGCPQWNDSRTNDPAVMQYCGFEGRVLNLLHSPLVTIHNDRWPQLAPAIWLGGCFANGSTPTQQCVLPARCLSSVFFFAPSVCSLTCRLCRGWTQASLKQFLAFLDMERVPRIGIWCMDLTGKTAQGGAMVRFSSGFRLLCDCFPTDVGPF